MVLNRNCMKSQMSQKIYILKQITIKILRGLINCFKLIKHDRLKEIKIEGISKRIKLHLYQIKKLDKSKKNYDDNKTFFYESVKVILCFMTEKIKLRYNIDESRN